MKDMDLLSNMCKLFTRIILTEEESAVGPKWFDNNLNATSTQYIIMLQEATLEVFVRTHCICSANVYPLEITLYFYNQAYGSGASHPW